MTPDDLRELHRTFLDEPERFEERFIAAAETLSPGPNSVDGVLARRGPTPLFRATVSWEAPLGDTDPAILDSHVGALVAAGAGPALLRRLQAETISPPRQPWRRVPSDMWVTNAATRQAVECPVQQAAACLCLLKRDGAPRDSLLLERNAWLGELANERLAELLIEFPLLQHSWFSFSSARRSSVVMPDLPLLMSMLMAGGAIMPTSAKSVTAAQVSAWAIDPVTTMALTTREPYPISDRGFLETLAELRDLPAQMLTSVLALDRLRFEASPATHDKTPGALSGIDPTLDDNARATVRTRLHDAISANFGQFVTFESSRIAREALGHGTSDTKAAEGSQLVATLLAELARSPTLHPSSFPVQFHVAADQLLENVEVEFVTGAEGPDGAPRHLLDIRLDELVAQMVAAGVYPTPGAAAHACAVHLFSPGVDHEFLLRDADHNVPDGAPQALILAFERYGVTREASLARLEAFQRPPARITAAARALCAERSMNAIIDAVATPVDAPAPRARRNAL